MRTKCFFSVLLASLSLLVSLCLSSCTDTPSYVDESGVPINLETFFDLKDMELPPEAFTSNSPVKVIGLRQECRSYSPIFADDAYIDENGFIHFINKTHYWLTNRLMCFTIYWPADAEVTMDDYGRITSGNCVVAGHSQPFNLSFPQGTTISDNRIPLREYINRK